MKKSEKEQEFQEFDGGIVRDFLSRETEQQD